MITVKLNCINYQDFFPVIQLQGMDCCYFPNLHTHGIALVMKNHAILLMVEKPNCFSYTTLRASCADLHDVFKSFNYYEGN